MKSRPGRPVNESLRGEKVPVMVRIAPSLDAKLKAAAGRNVVSKSQEVENRCLISFDREDLLEQVLAQSLGDRGAEVIAAIIEATKLQRVTTGVQFLGVTEIIRDPDAIWKSRRCFDQIREAILLILDRFQPEGEVPGEPPTLVEIVGEDDADFRAMRETVMEHPGAVAAATAMRNINRRKGDGK